MSVKRPPEPKVPEYGWPSTEAWGSAWQHYAGRLDDYAIELESRAESLCDDVENLFPDLAELPAMKSLRELMEGKP